MLDVSNLKKITEKNKTVLIRFDLNVPLNSIDDYISDRIIRIRQPILNLLNGNNKVIILSHLGRPCLLYTSPSPRDKRQSRMPSSA